MRTFADRRDAGRLLGARLVAARDEAGPAAVLRPDRPAVVLGLPRGGLPVAAEVAVALDAPLDVLLVRKVGAPGHSELAMGAVGEDGVLVSNPDVLAHLAVSQRRFAAVERRERQTLSERAARCRAVRDPEPIGGRTAVLVDDGVATGATARAACAVARARGAAAVVLATPVIARSTAAELRTGDRPVVDALVAVLCPETFGGVGQFYADFTPTSEDEVLEILRAAS